MEEARKLESRLALVTGGTRGIGRGIVDRLANAGATVVVTGRDEAKAKVVAEEVIAAGGKAGYLGADLDEDVAVDEVIPAVEARYGKLDILVNNAGIDADNKLVDVPLEDWRRVMRVNVEVPFRLGVAATKHFFEKEKGVIVNISSILGLKPSWDAGAYVPAKHALIGLTKQMALEWATRGVRVNAILPGLIKTDMTNNIWSTDAGNEYIKSKVPAGRIGEANDIGALAAFLSSDDAGFIIGESFLVDGGAFIS